MVAPAVPIRRDAQGVAHIVALSGGKDSSAMTLKMKELHPELPLNLICTPTGNESPEMFAHWRSLAERLGQPIYPIFGGTLETVCEDEGALPNFRMRFCTRRLKIEPYIAFCQQVAPAVSYVGLRADECDREGISGHGADISVPKPYGIEQRYPLRELGWGIAEVLTYLDSLGVIIPDRTDCELCFWQKLGEWYLLWLHRRERFNEGIAWEKRWKHTLRSPGRDTWPVSLEDLGREFEKGRIPEISLKMMEKRNGMCRACSL